MLENLKTTKFNDGTPITAYTFKTHVSSQLNLNTLNSLHQCLDTRDLNILYENDLTFDFYRATYNHLAIESGKLTPTGWRIPSVQDFKELETYVSESSLVGEEAVALKTETGWLKSYGNGTNEIVLRDYQVAT